MPKVPTLLYLDSDFRQTLGDPRMAPKLQEVHLLVIPEVFAHPKTLGWDLPSGITVNESRTLNPTLDYMSVYHPSDELLRKIQTITKSGEIDLVIIGNNNGSGVDKAKQIAQALRTRTIVIANFMPDPGDYTPHGYSRFCSRWTLQDQLLEVLALIR
jgi:hypothetical protein